MNHIVNIKNVIKSQSTIVALIMAGTLFGMSSNAHAEECVSKVGHISDAWCRAVACNDAYTAFCEIKSTQTETAQPLNTDSDNLNDGGEVEETEESSPDNTENVDEAPSPAPSAAEPTENNGQTTDDRAADTTPSVAELSENDDPETVETDDTQPIETQAEEAPSVDPATFCGEGTGFDSDTQRCFALKGGSLDSRTHYLRKVGNHRFEITRLTVCENDEFETSAPSLASDRKCTPLTVCAEGEVELRAPTATEDRFCGIPEADCVCNSDTGELSGHCVDIDQEIGKNIQFFGFVAMTPVAACEKLAEAKENMTPRRGFRQTFGCKNISSNHASDPAMDRPTTCSESRMISLLEDHVDHSFGDRVFKAGSIRVE